VSRFLLDTHAMVFWLSKPARLSRRALKELKDDGNEFFVSIMSLLEVRGLNEINRIRVPLSEITDYFQNTDRFSLLVFDERVLGCTENVSTRDPFDRVILATALAHNLILLTADRWMAEHFPSQVLW
jgi:PIN domain nuclease of toxin-antitoxin system